MTRAKIQAFIITAIFVFSILCAMGLNEVLPDITIPEISFKKASFNKSEDKSKSKSSTKKLSGTIKAGKSIDSYKGVSVYYNGSVSNVSGRNVTKDGYNLGLRYQCVEFVKRFYYEFYQHKMPDSYGNAKDFFDHTLSDGAYNKKRALYQFRNGSQYKPKANDILIFGPTSYNSFGHIAIISSVKSDHIEIVQQNPGAGNPSREKFGLDQINNRWSIDSHYVLGWLSISNR